MIRVYRIDNKSFVLGEGTLTDNMVSYWKNRRELFREVPNNFFLDEPVDCRLELTKIPLNTLMVRKSIAYWCWDNSWWPVIATHDIITVDGRLGIVQKNDSVGMDVRHQYDVEEYDFFSKPLDLRGIDLSDLSDQDRDWIVMELLR